MKKYSIPYLEELSFNAHPSLQTQYYDGWVLRFANGYIYIANVIVDEMYRGKGYGRRLCETLLAKAKEMGGYTAYLQVIQTNQIAINLYEKLGFEKTYSYWYRRK